MKRSVFAAIIGGFLGLTALVGVTCLSARSKGFSTCLSYAPARSESPNPPARGGGSEGSWRLLGPVTYHNLTVFPVVSSAGQDTSAFLTLEQGLSSGEVIVGEQGSEGMERSRDGQGVNRPVPAAGASVNQLVLINRSKRPLLLLAGELVSGGKQDRVIGKDRIVPAGGPPLPLDVFCVEHGRWTGSSRFAAAKTIVHPSVREQAVVNQNQSEVWSAVRSGTTAKPRPEPPAETAPISSMSLQTAIADYGRTEAYEKIYDSPTLGVSIDELVAEIGRRFDRETAELKGERVVGVIVAYGSEVAWSDIFASGDLFNHYRAKLLRSYAVEALARPVYREAASRDNAGEFLRHLGGRETQETEPGVYRWREIREGHLAEIELDSLQPKLLTLHRILVRRTS